MRTFLIAFLILFLLGALPVWPHSVHWGYFPSVGLGTVLLIALIAVLMSNRRIV